MPEDTSQSLSQPQTPQEVSPQAQNTSLTTSQQSTSRNIAQQTYAGFFVRVSAVFVDSIVLFIPIFLIIAILGLGLSALGVSKDSLDVVLQPVLGLIYIVTVLFFVTRFGATPGKIFFGLKIIRVDGSIPNIKTAFMREVAGKIVSGLLFNLGYIWAAFDNEKQSIHDKIAKTHVVFVKQLRGLEKAIVYVLAVILIVLVPIAIVGLIFFVVKVMPFYREVGIYNIK